MPPKIRKLSNQKKWKLAGEVRRSQVVGTYGPGAIVDFPRLSGIMAGLEEWNIHDGSLPAEARFTDPDLADREKIIPKSSFRNSKRSESVTRSRASSEMANANWVFHESWPSLQKPPEQ